MSALGKMVFSVEIGRLRIPGGRVVEVDVWHVKWGIAAVVLF